MTKPITALQLENLGFTYVPLVKEEEFQYDTWYLKISEIEIEVINEYELNGTFKSQHFCINNEENEKLTKTNFLDLVMLLKSFEYA